MRAIFALAGCAMLAACVPPQQQESRAIARQNQVDSQDDSRCRSFGTTPGTDAYTQCRLTLDQRRANAAAQGQALGMQYLMNRPAPAAAPAYQMPVSRPTNCTTSYVGT